MLCVVENLSPLPRRCWVTVTLPRQKAAALPVECTFVLPDGRRWRAVRGRSAGCRTVYRVRCHMNGGERLDGRITAEAHPDAAPMRWHPWISDDVAELVPVAGMANVAGGATIHWAEVVPGSLRLIDHSPAHQRWTVRQRLPMAGLHVVFWVDIVHDDPVAQVWGKVVWSDRGDPAPYRTFPQLLVRCGEGVAWDFATRNGISPAVPVGRDWIASLARDLTLKDGSGIALSGSMLAFVSNPEAPVVPGTAGEIELSVQDLYAAARGPALGLCREWGGEWLAARNLPRLSEHGASLLAGEEASWWQQFEAAQAVPAGWHADRPVGMTRTPGQAGYQSDFGATKGSHAVVLHRPRSIYLMRYAAHVEVLRGHNHYEADGRMMTAEARPQWVSWSRTTHWHPGVSTDRLGKLPAGVPQPWEHVGLDDEHCSMNYLAAYAALSDDPLIDDQIRHVLEIDRASYRMRFPNNGAGATRAQGRTAGTWAQLMVVCEDDVAPAFADLLARRITQTNASPSLRVDGPMRVASWGAPDNRKPFFDEQGNLGPWASMWEHGLFLVGFYKAMKAANLTTVPESVRIVAETMAEFALFQDDAGHWRTVTDLLWSDGAPPFSGMRHPSQQVGSVPGVGDVGIWTFAGLLVARKILLPSHPRWQRLDNYIREVTGGSLPWSRDDAEWWAIVDSVVATT